jgi:hypothetical protein
MHTGVACDPEQTSQHYGQFVFCVHPQHKPIRFGPDHEVFHSESELFHLIWVDTESAPGHLKEVLCSKWNRNSVECMSVFIGVSMVCVFVDVS